VKNHNRLLSVIPVPYQIRDRLQPESRNINYFWTPAFALWGVDPYPPACKPYGLEAGTESGVTALTTYYEFITIL
jgi:hypothetical protein